MPLSHKGCLGMLLIFQGDGSPTGLKRRAGEEKKKKKGKNNTLLEHKHPIFSLPLAISFERVQ